jgi:predicted RNA-binding protein with TRAM domain
MRFERRERGERSYERGGFRSDYGGGGGFRAPPVKVGDEIDVQVTEVARKGDGIAKVEGFIVFVPGTTKGDSCRIRIKEVARRFAVGEKVGEATGGAAMPAAAAEEEVPELPETA